MEEGQKIFEKKWHFFLEEHIDYYDPKPAALLYARDSRRKRLPRILYIDGGITNQITGLQFGRTSSNLVAIARQGFPVTAVILSSPHEQQIFFSKKELNFSNHPLGETENISVAFLQGS
jgi:hypothetical protein